MTKVSEAVAASPLVGGADTTLHSHAGAGLTYTELAANQGKTATGGAWEDWDISSYVPSGTKYVEVLVKCAGIAAAKVTGVRKNGSGLSRTFTIGGHSTAVLAAITITVEVDANRIIEIYQDAASTLYTFNLAGYWI